MFLGLLDSITSTADAKDCPGVCVHTLATIICYEVLDEVQCPSANMKCCVESNVAASNISSTPTTILSKVTTTRPKITPTTKASAKPTQKVEKQQASEGANKGTIVFKKSLNQ